ncbi:ulp1 protease family, C-terminal catalytic domain-containing protein [Tanacetum coccineum]|uniref:Ulp1 protease family, C-terminal catalytic domain-containing protein n=1 Tax=Tanacetum coccineum TaxID=301880 RepID=A0ABQ5CSP3_9ASTR
MLVSQEYYEKNILKFDIISDERSELVRTLRNGVKKIENDNVMIDFCKQYGELFNDHKFSNLYESSKEDDSEGEPDGDDENSNHDDDGAPTTDANKQKESDNQKKEQNKEEIDKETEESGSEGIKERGSEATEGGINGKEENMNGDEREVTAQLDVDNQNKKLNKEKDANETEDNDKMNNNKIDNVEEKQCDHKDETSEDEFWNTRFNDSQCEELKNQEKEEIKKKKTAKRKSTKEMTPPSFSLGLSPDTNKVEERAAKRAKKPSRFIVSPYINKKTATKGNAVHDEMMICSYLFSMEGSEFDFIFETKEGNATIRDYMQTLAPTLKIESNVIDTYCLVLNHEQGVNSKRKKTKHFFHTGMITKDMFNWKMEDGKKYDEVKQYKAFSDTMKNEFKKDDEVKKLKDLEMAFFPIIAHEHYYLVVFNFLKGTTVIIDNSKTPMSYEAKYKKVCDVLKNMFSMHLKEVQHPRAKDNYNGENARNWNLEFPTEEEGNRYDIIKMRMRFAAKMLSHEINIHREEMSKQALEFADRNKEKKAREALIRGAIRVKKEKQESERVQSAI